MLIEETAQEKCSPKEWEK